MRAYTFLFITNHVAIEITSYLVSFYVPMQKARTINADLLILKMWLEYVAGDFELLSLACITGIDGQWEMFHSMLFDSLNSFAPLHSVSSIGEQRGQLHYSLMIVSLKIKAKNRAKWIDISGSERDKTERSHY